MYLTEQEIMEQHIALNKTYDYMMEKKAEIKNFFSEHPSRKFVFFGCGSSYMLAKSGQQLICSCKGSSANAIAGGLNMPKEKVIAAIEAAGFDARIRPEGLTLEAFAKIQRAPG